MDNELDALRSEIDQVGGSVSATPRLLAIIAKLLVIIAGALLTQAYRNNRR